MAEPASPMIDALTAVHRALVAPEQLKVTMERLVELTSDAVPGAEQASITEASSSPSTVAHFGEDTLAVDQAQYEGGGPCVHAFQHRKVVVIDEISEDDRWPVFRDAATSRGLHASQSHPLFLEERVLGSVNLYSQKPGTFNEDTVMVGNLFAGQVAIALSNTQTALEFRSLTDQLREGMITRDVIGQAKGVLMAQHRITADAAFELLREASQRLNRKLREIAEEVAGTGEIPER